MRWLSDKLVTRLREEADWPDLTDTRYRLIRRLAAGGMGTVYLVEDLSLDRKLALKATTLSDPSGELAARMLKEAKIVARLEHPSIDPVHDVGALPDGRVFFTMKLVQGDRLDQYAQGCESRQDLLRIFLNICQAVSFAHAHGVIHRDLKPENIMVGSFGEVQVMDWGIAKVFLDRDADSPSIKLADRIAAQPGARRSELAEQLAADNRFPFARSVQTATGSVLGTPAYMSPEQAAGRTDLDPRTDVYALGAILKFLLAGRDFPAADGRRGRARKLPRALAAIWQRALAQDRSERYASAQEMAEDVTSFLDGKPVAAYRENPLERWGRWVRKHRFIVYLLLAYLLMRVLLLLWTRR